MYLARSLLSQLPSYIGTRIMLHGTPANAAHARRWVEEEQIILQQCVARFGPSWSLISSKLKGRSAHDCRLFFYKSLLMRNFQERTGLTMDKLYGPSPNVNDWKSVEEHAHRIKDQMEWKKDGYLENLYYKDFQNEVENMKKETAAEDEVKTYLNSCSDNPLIEPSSLFPFPDPVDALKSNERKEYHLLVQGYERLVTKDGQPEGDHTWIYFDTSKDCEYPTFFPVDRLAPDLPRTIYAFEHEKIKHIWTRFEDAVLREAFENFTSSSGGTLWNQVAHRLPRRTPEDCRNRLTELCAAYIPLS